MNELQNALLPRLNAALLRHFHSIARLTPVGDRHEGSSAALFFVEGANGKTQNYFARISKTAAREVRTYNLVSTLIRDKSYEVDVPSHRLIERDILVREYVPGFTLSELDTYYIACTEIQLLFERSRGVPPSLKKQITAFINGPRTSKIQLCESLLFELTSWDRYEKWRNAVGRFLSVPLPGESLRSLMHLFHAAHDQSIREVIPFTFDRQVFVANFQEKLASFVGEKDIGLLRGMFIERLSQIRAICQQLQIYDIHLDNVILGESGRLYVFDFECAGLGSSDRMLPDPVWFLEDLALQSDAREPTVAWAHKLPIKQRLNPMPTAKDLSIHGYVRVILCGTATYAKIIQTFRETLFIAVMFSAYESFELDEYDCDIAAFPAIWRDFQKLKRYIRGVSALPSNLEKDRQKILELRNYLFVDGCEVQSDLAIRASSLMAPLRECFPELGTIEYAIFMRIFEFLRFLPFEIITGTRVTRADIELSCARVLAGEPQTQLDSLLRTTLCSIFRASIPYHTMYLEGPYRFGSGIRRRVETKIRISEARVSNRAQFWLEKILLDIREGRGFHQNRR